MTAGPLICRLYICLALSSPTQTPEPLPDFDRLWDYSSPARTEALFREILPRARLSTQTGYLIELLTQLARTQSLQQKFGAAHRLLDEAEPMLRPELRRPRVRYLLERGRTFNSSMQQEKSRPLFLEAWQVAKGAGEDSLAVDAAHMMGIVEPPDGALAWTLKALALAENSSKQDAKRWLGTLYNNIGWTYFEQKELAASLAMLEKAKAWFQAHGKPEQIRVARWSVAKLWRVTGRVEEALGVQETMLKELDAARRRDGFVHEELAECLLVLERVAEARPHFAAAYELLSKDGGLAASEPERLQRLQRLSEDQ